MSAGMRERMSPMQQLHVSCSCVCKGCDTRPYACMCACARVHAHACSARSCFVLPGDVRIWCLSREIASKVRPGIRHLTLTGAVICFEAMGTLHEPRTSSP